MKLIRKFIETDMSSDGSISGQLSSYQLDKMNDRMMPGCFDNWLKGTDRIPILWSHNQSEVIGQWTHLQADQTGLFAKGEIYQEIQRGKETRDLIKRGVVEGLSIGFHAKNWEPNIEGGLNFLEVEVKEASVVLTPANEDGKVHTIKQEVVDMDVQEQEDSVVKLNAEKEYVNYSDVREVVKDEVAESVKQTNSDIRRLSDKARDIEVYVDKKFRETVMSGNDTSGKQKESLPSWQTADGGREIKLDSVKSVFGKYVTKDYTAQESVGGSSEPGVRAWFDYPDLNSYLALVGEQNVVSINGDGIALPKVDVSAFANVSTLPSSRSPGGDITETKISVKNFEIFDQFSLAAMDDVTDLQPTVIDAVARQFAAAVASEIHTVIETSVKDSASSSIQNVNTGESAAIPNTTNIAGRLAVLRQAVPYQYRSMEEAMYCGFVMSTGMVTNLLQASSTSGEWLVRPGTQESIYGCPFFEYSGFDAGGTAADHVALFGNFAQALTVVFAKELEIRVFDQTRPGAMTYYARGRFGVGLKNVNAIRGMIVGS